ncbi:hypothetical protein NHX12_030230 [Muraenolepis orangiensis]|uniref:Major facilitator superfamily (MFS) profile domain-containing protein n=1 Tax=Muraenolepis orangiensis TaxID=630683 RepID=A0A9Q0E890_9TELE|nr:hypothetical protein NHX12_030230 [Muraenolepis orangiensis]
MNELNVKLQGKDQFAHDMYTNVRAFKSKLVLFSRQMSNKSFAHFPTLAVQKEAARNAKKYCKSLDDLHREFCRRFCDFEKIDKSLQLVSCPLSQDPESAPQELQLELIDLQSDSVSKEKFKSLKLNDFYASLNETAFPNLRRTAQKMLVLFGSTYVCEQTFSVMKINKAHHRSKLTDQHLRSYIQSFINSSWYQRYEETPPPQTITLIWSLIISAYAVGGLCGAASIKFFNGKFGRRKTMAGNNLFFIVGGVVMLTSKYANSFEMIVVARFLFGIGSGLGGSTQLMYLGESAPKQLRGPMTLSLMIFVSLGKLSGQMVVLPLLPDAPRYLLIEKGDLSACKKALQSLWGPGEYQAEIDEMLQEKAGLKGVQNNSLLEFLRDRSVRCQVITIGIISACMQLSGVSAVSIFSFDILHKADVPVDQIRYVTLGFGGSEVLASIASRTGRRPLLFGGFGVMFTMLVLITVTLNLENPGATIQALLNDSFVQSRRPAALSLLGIQRWGQLAILGLIFPFILEALGSFCFLLFACFCLLGALYSYFVVPETKGKTQLEVSRLFNSITVCGMIHGQVQVRETKL